ncbi:glycoside hydrolase family 76 protein [Cercospora zeae-maydis SCOH1-5]|uniref:Glycoside hydrolase family 76 protein n=1 Tax=Cercospora zeae-maydis SCOH1-5 TaxID=717836 RepID=A0A6A6EVT0_9PEZI|nr:glycoside hydrolase family 76 protein [Cercospora zeae-maydis SCOH1-5]
MFFPWLATLSLVRPIAFSSSAAVQTTFWDGYRGDDVGWRYTGPDPSADFWFNETQDALATMQAKFWNGTYWPGTLQWIGALVDTIVASTERTFVYGLQVYGGDIKAQLESDIRNYYTQIQAYYDNEDTIQIFDAAYDDAQWVVMEWLEVIRFIQQYDAYSQSGLGIDDISAYAHRAHIFYNIVQNEFNTSQCGGGLTWNPALETYKNAITNELFVSSSIMMYFYFPGDNDTDPYPDPDYTAQTNRTLPPLEPRTAHDPLFLQNAEKEWAWFKTQNFTNAQGLIVDGFHISPNQTTCDERNEMVYTYNQAVMLTGLRGLWEATGGTSYLDDGYNLIEIVMNATGWDANAPEQASEWAGLGRNGILEDYCDAPANCSHDDLIFKGAYFQHFDYFCTPLPTVVPLVEGVSVLASTELAQHHSDRCASYLPWVQHNAHAALNTRDGTEIMGEWWGAPYVRTTCTIGNTYSQTDGLQVEYNAKARTRICGAEALRKHRYSQRAAPAECIPVEV